MAVSFSALELISCVTLEISLFVHCEKQIFFSSLGEILQMNLRDSSNIPVVFLTGFGPFRSIEINPSWQVARALLTFVDWSFPIRLVVEQVQVVYDEITRKIPRFWQELRPTVGDEKRDALLSSDQSVFSVSCASRRCTRNPGNPLRTACVEH